MADTKKTPAAPVAPVAPAPMPTQQERPDLYDAPDFGPRTTKYAPFKWSPEMEKRFESDTSGKDASKDDQDGAPVDTGSGDGK